MRSQDVLSPGAIVLLNQFGTWSTGAHGLPAHIAPARPENPSTGCSIESVFTVRENGTLDSDPEILQLSETGRIWRYDSEMGSELVGNNELRSNSPLPLWTFRAFDKLILRNPAAAVSP